MKEELFVVVLYGCVKGICTEDNKEKVIEEIANSEFNGDIIEAVDYIDFQDFTINKLKL